MSTITTDILIIGSGPAGLFASFQAGMLGMKSVIVDILDIPGGQCSTLYPEKPIYDIPAYPQILAQDLIDKLITQIEPFGVKFFLSQQANSLKIVDDEPAEEGNLNSVRHSAGLNNRSFILGTSSGNIIKSKIVVIAAGSGSFGPNRPPLADIEKYEGKSIFYSVPQKDFFSNKKVLIAGGGDSALDWAISLSEIAEVSIVHRRARFRAAPATVAKLKELESQSKIKIITNYQLDSLVGSDSDLKEVVLSDLDSNKLSIKTDVLLPFFGLKQDLGPILDFGLNIRNHHIEVQQPNYETSVSGIYALGDVAHYNGKLKLILTSFAEAASIMHHAYHRVFEGKALHFEYSTSKLPHLEKI